MIWNPGHIQKAKKKIVQLLKAVNYVVEVRDARAPYATGAYEREKLFRGKKTVLVLNKADIADERTTEAWMDFYGSRGERVVVSKKGDRSKRLLKELFGERGNVRVLIVGLPNVGKSSFINRLKGRKSAKVGAVPGVTRGAQWIQVNDRVKIVDTPGVLYSKLFSKRLVAKLILTGSLPIELVDGWEELEIAFSILKERYPGFVREMVGEVSGLDEFLISFGKKRGFLLKGGRVDIEKAKNTFFQEIAMGKYGRLSFEDPSEVF